MFFFNSVVIRWNIFLFAACHRKSSPGVGWPMQSCFPRRWYMVCTSIYTVGTWHQSWLMSLRWWRETVISHRYMSSCFAAHIWKYVEDALGWARFGQRFVQRRASRLWITDDIFPLESTSKERISPRVRVGFSRGSQWSTTKYELARLWFSANWKHRYTYSTDGAITSLQTP